MTMMKSLVLIVVSCIVSCTVVSAVDVGTHQVRRGLATTANVESPEEEFRQMVLQTLHQFDTAYTQLQQKEYNGGTENDDIECVPCRDIGSDHHGRMLRMFPKLVSRANPPAKEEEEDFITTFVSDLSGSQLFGGNNSTMGGIFDLIGDSPLLLLGGITLALVVILPLAILEAISITTATPILCILGFASSILFGECRRRRSLVENEVVRQLLDNSFFSKYFPNGRIRQVDVRTDATSDLQELIQIGLSPGMIGYLNEVTVASFVYDIATHNATRPLTSTALLALTPFLMLEQISDVTNTPVRCIVGNCNNRQLQASSSSSLSSSTCEIDYFRCQMKKTLMILG
jgi:hypothetical protein